MPAHTHESPRHISLATGQLMTMTPSQDGAATGLDGASARCKNRILAALPEEAWERLSPYLRRILLHQSNALQESGSAVEYVYFVEKGMISLVVDASDGSQVEVGVTGREGVVGALSVLGDQPSLHRAVVQIPGNAYRLPVGRWREECQRSPDLQELLNNYLYVLMVQASQSALCNRMHTVEERLSRWLLTVRDCVASNELDLTHEFISHMLGVRRSGVTVALGVLQQAGLIDSTRGHIAILDAPKMKSCACECYDVIHKQFKKLESRAASERLAH